MSLKKGIGAYLLMKNDANWQKLDNQSRLSKTAEENSDGKARKLISWSKNMQRSNFWTTLLIRFEQGWRNRGMRGGACPQDVDRSTWGRGADSANQITTPAPPRFSKSPRFLASLDLTDRRIYIWDKFSSQKAPKHEKKIVLGCICNAKNLEAQRFCSFSSFEIDLAHLHMYIFWEICKVWTFWKGHKNLNQSPTWFKCQIKCEIVLNFEAFLENVNFLRILQNCTVIHRVLALIYDVIDFLHTAI